MTLEVLSSIKGAKQSGAVSELFMTIKSPVPLNGDENSKDGTIGDIVSFEDLRNDVVVESTSLEKKIIKENFPVRKNDFLVVPKVIEG